MAELLGEFALLLDDCAQLVEEKGAFIERSTSVGAGLEAFLRGFLGDPLGPYYETKDQLNQLEARWQKLMARMSAVQQRENVHNAEADQVRARLTEEYNREFPSLRGGGEPNGR